MSEEDKLFEEANYFILDKLLKIFGIMKYKEKEKEVYEKYRPSIEDEKMKKDLRTLYLQPNSTVVIGITKDQFVSDYKDRKKRSVLILKTNKGRELSKDMSQNFLFIELNKRVLDELYILCKDVFFPMLTQSVQQADSSELISKELMEKFHNFLSHFYVCLGHINGETKLPEPSDEIFRNPKINDNEKTQICEGAVVMWIDLIRYILKQEPEHDFRHGGNPLPATEIDFWKNKSESWNSILDQIKKEKISEILKFLEKQKSAYHKMFNEIKNDVRERAKECNYNYKHLLALDEEFKILGDDNKELVDVVDEFEPIFHIIRKIWSDNEYYGKSERLIVLIRKICNALIEKATAFLHTNIVSKITDEPIVYIGKIDQTKNIITDYMKAYYNGNAWKITRNVVFYRLDTFNDRIGDILNIARSYNEFSLMATKTMGGIKGEELGNTLVEISNECAAGVKAFGGEDFNALDISSDEFNVKYSIFKDLLKELERKISAVLTQAFDESDTILGKFKVLDSFDVIWERPYIVVELEKKYNILLEAYKSELRIVQNLFLNGKKLIENNDPKNPWNKNMPPIAAMLNWTESLKVRCLEPLEKFEACGKRITEKEEFNEIKSSQQSIYNMIRNYEDNSKLDWDIKAKEQSNTKQKEFILSRMQELINVNFDPELLQILKEVKYLKILNKEIPEEAEQAFRKNDDFRKQNAKWNNIKSQYNTIISTWNDVEKPMIRDKLQKVESILDPAFNTLTWEMTKDIDDFIGKALNIINDLATTVERLKAFVSKIHGIFEEWVDPKNMLFVKPKDLMDADALNNKFDTELDAAFDKMALRVKDIAGLGEVQLALKSAVSNLTTFKEKDEWKNYLHYINSLVLNGIIDLIYSNLHYWRQCLDPHEPPFCKVNLLLENKKIVFHPEFRDTGSGKSIKMYINSWINSFIKFCTLFKQRVDISMGDYMIEVISSTKVQQQIYLLYNEVSELSRKSDAKLTSFGDLRLLWEKDFEENFHEFLKENTKIRQNTPDDDERQEKINKIFNEANPNPITKNIVEYTPSQEVFDDKINEYKEKWKKVKNMEKNVKIRWVMVDFSEFQKELSNIIENWIERYKDFLQNNSRSKLANITEFMAKIEKGIQDKPKETKSPEARKKFYTWLENIRDMDLLFPKIKELIPGIKGELELLKKHTKNESTDDPYDIEEKNADSEDQRLLEKTAELEKNIIDLKKNVENSSEEINTLVDVEKENFKTTKSNFDKEVENFRTEFLKNAPKEWKDFTGEEIKSAYETWDDYFQRTSDLEQQKKANNDMELLLKIPLSYNKQISDCFNELKLYKTMWDFIAYWYSVFESWKQIKMKEANIFVLAEEIDIWKASLKGIGKKEIKQGIPAFKQLEKRAVQMDDTIQIVQLLKDKVIKKRHWKHLMEITKKSIPYDDDDNFTIKTLVDLQMFKVKSDVEDEKAVATEQDKIETKYTKIDKTWQSQNFKMTQIIDKKKYDFYLFDHGEMDGVIETLEKDQNDLIQMYQKKGILENFEGMDKFIESKLNQLKTVNVVIKTWLKLQKTWEKLNVIFLNSDDIKNKLRNEYADFVELNIKFVAEMKIAYDYNTIIDVCTEARKVVIDDITTKITGCQNALNNYLETKKKKFPRFYFLSNETLLGMLASANYPNLINKNIKDCFVGMKAWQMEPVDADNRSRTVLAILSAENDEVVDLHEPFVCEGDLVENYLSEFERVMKSTLSAILNETYTTVKWNWALPIHQSKKECDRHQWLNPFPAQLSLLVTQIVWTEEVEHALELTEGGDSGALKDYYSITVDRIEKLIERVRDERTLSRDWRVKIITIITVDVHGRDVVEAFSLMKPAIDANNFNWKKQLRFKYSTEHKNSVIEICGFKIPYSFEYIGNTGRLVITPLTDRCYITLTQALDLVLGGAPAGPAGTGKTETVKDLGRNLGLGVIVNNCSEQMSIETTARIFSGLAQTGFWGCFDEFNRICIEVLSVVSTQVKCVLDAIRVAFEAKPPIENPTFTFEGSEINLTTTCGMFITMNPGYAGRTELPDNLKALFRSCAMVVPDLKEICQNMLMSEGFSDAKTIASKFITWYNLSRDLLSKQKHYDWGLRAIKSLLRQAGGLKRLEANKNKAEAPVIMKALFDFNKAKIVPDDLLIFERLLHDWFKKDMNDKDDKEEDINQKINEEIDKATECEDVNLNKDSFFTLKTRQLKETLEVRHCLFILGAPGCGKTSVWKTLFYTNKNFWKQPSGHEKLSPKAITGKELFGYEDEKSKVWSYGILSSIVKKMCKNDPPYSEAMQNKWIILDGDIDPNWIESLNTVMDDNKVLTLTNGDRFPLDEFMRLIFEISNLRNATLATVSRGGVLYINEKDIGITPFFDKWMKKNYGTKELTEGDPHQVTKRVLEEFFKTTFDKVYEWKEIDAFIAPICEISLVQNFCTIFQNLIKQVEKDFENIEDERKAVIVEGIFFFSFMWGVGGGWKDRRLMNTHLKSCIKSKTKLHFPESGICFDFYFDPKNTAVPWASWKEKLKDPVFEERDLFSDIIIPNVEVTRLSYISQINMLEERPVLYIGNPGTGKTAIVNYFMKNYMEELQKLCYSQGYTYKNYTINFNSYTDSKLLQEIIDSQITQRYSNKFGPLGNTKLIFFLDDLNMPQLDQFGTQSHVELLRQAIDYKEYFDRKDLDYKKNLLDLLFVGCQNPKAGSFWIDLRLQRHFTLLATSVPDNAMVSEIYTFILKNHFKEFKFNDLLKDANNKENPIDRVCKRLIEATCLWYSKIITQPDFNPSATKFHYQWNLREIAHVIDGVLRTSPATYSNSLQVYKLWYHECNRVFRDRLIFTSDMKQYDNTIWQMYASSFGLNDPNLQEIVKEPFIFVPFGPEMTDEFPNVLLQPKTYDDLKKEIAEYLERYNEEKGVLPLVLFDDAIKDICRISRIIVNPCSHALLIGVGGSGKQSLSNLAAFIKETEITSPNLSGTDYNNEAFLADLKMVMMKSVLKQSTTPYCFLINDNHIIDEYFLVYINTFLSSYWVDEIFEEKAAFDTALNPLKSTAANFGFAKSSADCPPEALYNYLLYRVKNNVHFIICMSPVGDILRRRCRKFPSLLNNTCIDWFHEWPDEALKAVSSKAISEMPEFNGNGEMIEKLSIITTELHKSIKEFNENFYKSERRYNYTTPKSFLELINYYGTFVQRKSDENEKQTIRLKNGLSVVANTSEKIAALQWEIETNSVEVDAKKKSCSAWVENLTIENEKNAGDKEIAEVAAAKAKIAKEEAEEKLEKAATALAKAWPIKIAAENSAKDIDKKELDEFKKPAAPSKNNYLAMKLIYIIIFPDKKVPGNDIAKELPKIKSACLNKSGQEIKDILISKLNDVSFVNDDFLQKVDIYLNDPWTDEKFQKNICQAVYNFMKYFFGLIEFKKQKDIVDPLEIESAEAEEKSRVAIAEKTKHEDHLEKVSKKQKQLEKEWETQQKEWNDVIALQTSLENKLAAANKLIGLLRSSNARWGEEVINLEEFKKNIAGDCILGSSFISYIGVFNAFFRTKIIQKWKKIIVDQKVILTDNIENLLIKTLVSEDKILKMKAEGLPSDPFSEENSVIITQSTRYPLIIDPQMQAIAWLKNRNDKNTIVQYKQAKWDMLIGDAIGSGEPIIIEDVDQEIDPMLVPIMGKQTTNKDKGGKAMIRVGSNDYPFNNKTPIYFITKISNPHYKPEIAAQCSLINFIVTEKGLEDQLLAMVVNIEQPDLEENIRKYVTQINDLQSKLINSEDDVLRKLNDVDQSTILDNTELINSLENTKNQSNLIETQKAETNELISKTNLQREIYRGVGEEGAMLYFLISKLFIIQGMYQYSLNSFVFFFEKAIAETEKFESLTMRVQKLREKIRLVVYVWIAAGMFEKDKQWLLTMIAMRLLQKKGVLTHDSLQGVTQKHLDFLLKCYPKFGIPKETSLDFINENQWNYLNALSDLDGLQGFAEKVAKEYASKFRDWYNEISPEEVDLPPEWKRYKRYSFHKILILRACRPERVGVALNAFIEECLPQGKEFLIARTFSDSLLTSYFDSKPEVPIFFILSPGSNPIKDLEILGGVTLKQKIKKTFTKEHGFKYIAMGQNAEKGAEEELKNCSANGEWLFLQNIHLMPKWLKTLEDKMKEISKEKGHEDFRLYLSAEPSDNIPVGILEKCIKLTNEPPSGLKENMKIAHSTLKNAPGVSQQDDPRRCAVIFGLCYYHSVVIERKKFGSLGWNRNYPFNLDDLRNSDSVVAKYLEQSTKVPWEDLKYIVGEIMYGGHIVDDWDRKLNNAYLDYLLCDKLNDNLNLVPYPSGTNVMKVAPIVTPITITNYPFENWGKYIDLVVTTESPALFGLHPNAELEYRIMESETLFRNLIDLEPKDSSDAKEGGENSAYDAVKARVNELSAPYTEGIFDLAKWKGADREWHPSQNVFLQECEQMTALCLSVKKNCLDVNDAIDGKLTMDERIEKLIFNWNAFRVPAKWIDDGYATTRSLADWIRSLTWRIDQLKKFFDGDFAIPAVVFLNRLFNPLSYLTAIRQGAAGPNEELDKLDIFTECTSVYLKDKEPIVLKKSTGIPIYGLHLQGCRYDEDNRIWDESRPKEKYFVLPIILCKVQGTDRINELKNSHYICPIYKTINRQSTFVCFAQFKTKAPPAKWTIAGVAVILDCIETDAIEEIKVQGQL